MNSISASIMEGPFAGSTLWMHSEKEPAQNHTGLRYCTSQLQTCEKYTVLFVSYPVCGAFIIAAQMV